MESTFIWVSLVVGALIIALIRFDRWAGRRRVEIMDELSSPPPSAPRRDTQALQEAANFLANGREAIATAHATEVARAGHDERPAREVIAGAKKSQRLAWDAMIGQAELRFGRLTVSQALRHIGASRI